ncbi:MAG: 16S rRNA (cytosine(1402)-N(4))-methyltransferase RsmH [Rhodospirillaceae bacterium]|nr:16S rRNA (cytosine(1402)-N(4))-methyltransferase RsmH [Rhodospirillaceae bacterium]MBT4671827.1 16S rRNA (cytosine(1402)-N(4))-methyltransferase RsmH [Rhodospirillaceae bacterium]MBT4750225.1 16S rRNA (cytosine(1402)-N(4))-methyltransferase RsmH [Rhodospirillaceae bacterium]MBT5177860.1 16S rRNA (cytosine(1402)-N(4))-methyltransferase RsmH [Rhodospirillaceae bacterium]MBT5840984.1 16S rRNA (cytosine(1402)-N(4))-methyltransferase RsmH [Rhodospirillaceae bacterium]
MSLHIPIMTNEVLGVLDPRDGGTYVDGTFGRGGHSRAILAAAKTRVFAIDRDPEAIVIGSEMGDRLQIIEGRFGDMRLLLAGLGIERIDGVLLDLGVSSPQLDDAARGFSFQGDGPLDMRMGGDGPTAAELVNSADEQELADIIYNFGEERRARRVARAIVEARAEKPFTRTSELARVIRRVVRASKDGLDPATRTFMGLRIHVNDELEELRRGLAAAEQLLAPGGRLAVISFHSLEDRIAKTFLHQRADKSAGVSRHLPEAPSEAPSFRLIKRGAIKPAAAEARSNPRARSARLRAAIRTDAPAWAEAA